MNNTIGIIVGIIVLGGVVLFAGTSMNKSDTALDSGMQKESPETEDSIASKDGDTMVKDDMDTKDSEGMVDKEKAMDDASMDTKDKEMANTDTMEEKDMMKNVGTYEAYAPEKLARAEEGDVVLFFHATWCPSCRGLSADIEKNMSEIPASLSILKLDYDSETDLKKKYGVTTQHTLVQVSADGTLIKKWSGSNSLASLVSQVN